MGVRGGVTVKVPKALDELPERLEQELPHFLLRMAEGMAGEIARAEGGRIGRTFVGELVEPNVAIVKSTHPGAKVQDVGGYIKPKPERASRRGGRPMLKFQVGGETVFRPASRIPARHYTRQALMKRRRVKDLAYELTYGELLR